MQALVGFVWCPLIIFVNSTFSIHIYSISLLKNYISGNLLYVYFLHIWCHKTLQLVYHCHFNFAKSVNVVPINHQDHKGIYWEEKLVTWLLHGLKIVALKIALRLCMHRYIICFTNNIKTKKTNKTWKWKDYGIQIGPCS